MGFSGPWGPPGGPSPGAPIGEKRKTWLDNYLKYLHANFEINQSSPSTQKSQAIRNADPLVSRALGAHGWSDRKMQT